MKGKLEKEERDQLIAAGQQLKEALSAVEEKVGMKCGSAFVRCLRLFVWALHALRQ